MNGAGRAVTMRGGPDSGRSPVGTGWWVATLLALAGVGALLWAPVSAGAKTMQQKLEIACSADGARLCSGSRADPDRLKACLLSRRPQVSEPCMRLIDASE